MDLGFEDIHKRRYTNKRGTEQNMREFGFEFVYKISDKYSD